MYQVQIVVIAYQQVASVTVVLTVVGIERLFFLNVKGHKITKGVINHVGMVSSILLLLI
jgi:hypothetical protein